MPIVTCPNCGAKNRVDDRAQSLQPVCGRCGTPLPAPSPQSAPTHPISLDDSTFDSVISSAADKPVLVDCWAPWCGPCRMLTPTIDQLAAESNGRYLVAKLNTDENPRTASRYQISAIPTLLFFKNGQLANRLTGLHPKPTLASHLSRLL